MRYFIAGNFWLFLSLLIFLGRHTERTQPTRVSFLGFGTWFSPAGYAIIPILCLIVAGIFFFLCWRTTQRG